MATRLDPKTYLRIAVIFGLASYTTMLVIIGILSFMLWPGQERWFQEGGYLNGFYGPNTFSQLGMRTAFMFTMTAVVGGIVAARFEDRVFKAQVLRRLAWMGLISTAAGMLLLQWYLGTLPDSADVILANRLPQRFVPAMVGALVVIGGYFALTLFKPGRITPAIATVATVVILVFGLWPEEVARESIRKPFVAGQYVYSNQIIGRDVPGMGIKSEVPLIEAHGMIKPHVFAPDSIRVINDANRLEAGRFLALTACSNCHSLTPTGMRPLARYFGGSSDVASIGEYLTAALSTGSTIYMPRIPLQEDEARALATYIASLAPQPVGVKAAKAAQPRNEP